MWLSAFVMVYQLSGACQGEVRVIQEEKKARITLKQAEGEERVVGFYKDTLYLWSQKWHKLAKYPYSQRDFCLLPFVEGYRQAQDAFTYGEFTLKGSRDKHGWVAGKIQGPYGEASFQRIRGEEKEADPALFPGKKRMLLGKLKKMKSLLLGKDQVEPSATAGPRGVGEEGNMNAQPDYEALEKVDAITVSDQEVKAYKKERGLP